MQLPKYVEALVERIDTAPVEDQDAALADGCFGYVYRLNIRNNSQYWHTFEAERLVAWCNRMGAFSKIVGKKRYSTKEHRKPYHKRDHFLLIITDPVANALEKRKASLKEEKIKEAKARWSRIREYSASMNVW